MDEQEPDKAREIAPFQVTRRGTTTVSPGEGVTFTDFGPRILPADAEVNGEELNGEAAPKDSSALESAESSSEKQDPLPGMAAHLSADRVSGLPKVSEQSLPTSSSETNPG